MLILSALLLLSSVSCSKDKEKTEPQESKEEFYSLENVSYGEEARQEFDMVMPRKNANGGVIVMIHGGAWSDGGKDELNYMNRNFYRDGFTFATINYRFASDKLDMDDLLDDITSALKKIQQTAKEYGIELTDLMLGGISAGGQMALLYSYSRRDVSPITVRCCVGMSAVCDMTAESVWIDTPLDKYMSANHKMVNVGSHLCGFDFDKTNFKEAVPYLEKISPLFYAGSAVPTILAHGVEDDIIKYDTAVSLYNALTENGTDCSFISFSRSGHLLESDPSCKINLNLKIEEYAEKYLTH